MTDAYNHWYDKDDNSGWHTFTIENTYFSNDYFNVYDELVDWIYQAIDMPTRHARWKIEALRITIKFRYERDYLLCVLRWS